MYKYQVYHLSNLLGHSQRILLQKAPIHRNPLTCQIIFGYLQIIKWCGCSELCNTQLSLFKDDALKSLNSASLAS